MNFCSASNVSISGRILDESTNEPIKNAKIQYFDGLVPISLLIPVGLTGKFFYANDKFNGSHIILKIFADKYENYIKSVELLNGISSNIIIRLKRLPTLKLSNLTVTSLESSNESNIDLFINNESEENIIIKKFSIRGQKKKATTCLDMSGMLMFNIKDSKNSKEVIVTESGHLGQDKAQLSGEIKILPCDQAQLTYDIVYLYNMKPKEISKLRIKLPKKIKYKNEWTEISLSNWETLYLNVTLENNQLIISILR